MIRRPSSTLLAICLLGGSICAVGPAGAAADDPIPPGPPYPDPIEGVRVYDQAGVLGPFAIEVAETTIDEIEERSGAQIVVYTQVKPESDTYLEAEADAAALMEQWDVGREGIDDGLVILFDLDPGLCYGQIQLYAGAGYAAGHLSGAERQALFEEDMVPPLQDCDFDTALLSAMARISSAAGAGPERTATPSAVAAATTAPVVDPSATAPPATTPSATPWGPVWTHQFGHEGYDSARAVAVGSEGNVYVIGWVDGALPGQSGVGAYDAFVRAYSSAGDELWTRQFGTDGDDVANGVAVDGSGIVYVVGATSGALPGQSGAGAYDAYVRAYAPGGDELWTRQFGTDADDSAYGATSDGSGVLHVVGLTVGTLEGQTSAGATDAFIRSYDQEGQVVRTIQFGTIEDDAAYDIAAHATGDLYVAGVTTGVFRGLDDEGLPDAFVRVYDPQGAEVWTGQSTFDDAQVTAEAVAVGAGTEAFLALDHTGSADGEQDGSFATEVSGGGGVWSSHVAGDTAYGIAVGPDGSVYLAGLTWSSLSDQASAGRDDAFVRVWDADWNLVGDVQFGSDGSDTAFDLAVDGLGDVYVVGETYGALPGQTDAGGGDAFVTKYSSSEWATASTDATPQPTLAEVDVVELYPRDLGAGPLSDEDLTVRSVDTLNESFSAYFAESTGQTPDDVTTVMATHELPEADVFLVALQVRGADAAALEEAVIAWHLEARGFTSHEQVTISDEEVAVFLSDEGDEGWVDAAWVSDDIAWIWSAPDWLSEDILRLLPE